jgi:hypothetical protein
VRDGDRRLAFGAEARGDGLSRSHPPRHEVLEPLAVTAFVLELAPDGRHVNGVEAHIYALASGRGRVLAHAYAQRCRAGRRALSPSGVRTRRAPAGRQPPIDEPARAADARDERHLQRRDDDEASGVRFAQVSRESQSRESQSQESEAKKLS